MEKKIEFKICLEKKLYSKASINKTAEDFKEFCTTSIEETENLYHITLESDNENPQIPLEFSNFCLGYMKK